MADSPGRKRPPPIYVLDDDEDEVVTVDSSGSSGSSGGAASEDQRRPGGREAASGHSVVDLTSDNKRGLSSSARNNRANGGDDEEEVEFVGSSSSRASQQQFHQYRSEPSSSYVRFLGTKRSRPAPAAAAAAGRFGQYGSLGNAPGGGYAARAAGAAATHGGFNPLDYVGMLDVRGGGGGGNWKLSSPASGVKKAKKAKKKRSKSPPPPSPMEKGKAILVPTGFDALDMYYPHLNAANRTSVMHGLLPEGYSKKWTHEWRVAYDKAHPRATLWGMATALSDEITGINNNKKKGTGEEEGDEKLPVKKKEGNGGKENQKPSLAKTGKPVFFPTKKSNNDDSDDDEDQKLESVLPTPSIGPLSGKVINDLRTYFRAHVNRVHHKASLEGIEPVDADEHDGGHGNGRGVAALICSICADTYDATYMVPCSGEDELHFFCKSCFVSYATVTVQSGPVQSLVCPMPDCDSLFATADANANLSEWDKLMIEHRETSRDRRVALAAEAVLHCECGAVAIITKNDVGNGRIVCPGASCGKRYCCKCGNDDHGTDPCPPPAETVQWLDKHSKECPNCKNRIEKNGGCDHMTCLPSAGGCGHEFWWTCGCPYKGGQHRPGCKRFRGG